MKTLQLASHGIAFAKIYLGLEIKGEHHLEDDMVNRQKNMTSPNQRLAPSPDGQISREQLIFLLNEDLAREYQSIISYVVYSQVLKGAAYMTIAKELEKHAKEELDHALTIAKQIDYLGGTPTVAPKAVKMSTDDEELLRLDLSNENETVRNYRERVVQCEALGEYAMAEQIRDILVAEQEHQIDLATALGKDVAEVAASDELA